MPWVSEPSAKPPFRPLAPKPTVSASSTTTSRAGSLRLGVEGRPEPGEPAPTMQRSASTGPSSSGCGSRGGRASSQ